MVLAAGPVELTAWPVALRDARPAVIDRADPGWPAGLAALVGEARADRPPGWSPPPRPPMPDQRSVPAPAAGARAERLRPCAIDDDVQFTLYRPGTVSPRRWHWLLLFAHKSEGGPELDDPLAEVRRQAEGILGAEADDYGTLTADSAGSLRRGTTLLIEPWLDGATFNPPTVELQWYEPVHRADFRFQVAEGGPAVARGGVRIFAGVVLIGELTMTVRVASGEDAAAPPQRADRFRRIFASYAHADAEVVDRLAAAVGVLGDEYIIDSRNLRSGEDWERQIEGFIEQADVFQLFWSSNALRSPYVLAECRHALSLDRDGFIRPVVWEDPFPQDVDADLPPAPIRRLHFSRLMDDETRSAAAAARTAAAPAASAPPPMTRPTAAPPPPPPVPQAGAAAPGGPIRPSTAPPPTRSAQRRSRVPWAAAALVAVLGVGAGAFALQGGGDDGDSTAEPFPSATPGTSPSAETTEGAGATQPTVAPTVSSVDGRDHRHSPDPDEPTVTEPTVTEVPTACDAACLRAAFPFMDDGECEDVDPPPGPGIEHRAVPAGLTVERRHGALPRGGDGQQPRHRRLPRPTRSAHRRPGDRRGAMGARRRRAGPVRGLHLDRARRPVPGLPGMGRGRIAGGRVGLRRGRRHRAGAVGGRHLVSPAMTLDPNVITVIDGGTGTEIQRRGVPMDDRTWCAEANLIAPDVVRDVHRSYVEAGAQLLIANTFASSPFLFSHLDRLDELAGIDRRAVELAREAAEGRVPVAGSFSTMRPGPAGSDRTDLTREWPESGSPRAVPPEGRSLGGRRRRPHRHGDDARHRLLGVGDGGRHGDRPARLGGLGLRAGRRRRARRVVAAGLRHRRRWSRRWPPSAPS